jgi:ATP-binding cassette subfamily B protein
MIKLARYLKPFIPGLIIAIVLLFAQAVFDLNLPNYMSDIVNVGIQQNGIAESTPAAISPAGYTFVSTFMSAEEQALLDASYSQKRGTDQNERGRQYQEIYPAAASAPIYVLADDLAPETVDQLDTAFGTAVWTMINVMRSFAANTGAAPAPPAPPPTSTLQRWTFSPSTLPKSIKCSRCSPSCPHPSSQPPATPPCKWTPRCSKRAPP